MKRVKTRRKNFRISNPIGFSLFIAACLLTLGLIVTLIVAAVGYGPDAVQWVQGQIRGTVEEINEQPTFTPAPTAEPTETPEPIETPVVGTPNPSTPTPEPIGSMEDTPEPTKDPGAPLYGFIIGIDAGRDVSSKYTDEVAYNLEFANQLKSYLEDRGATVVLTRTSNDERLKESERGKLIKASDCDIALEVRSNHINKNSSGCYVRYGASKEYARELVNAYSEATGIKFQSGKKNGIEKETNDVIHYSGCPCVRLMMCNWDNPADRATIQDDATRQKICEAIYNVLLGRLKG